MNINIKLAIIVLSAGFLAFVGCKKDDYASGYVVTNVDTVDNPITIAPIVSIGPSGNSYYVSSLIGADTSDGLSSTTPFKSISKAVFKATAGDTVFFMNGTYTANNSTLLNITKSGSGGRYITYKAYPGHNPVLYGPGTVWNIVSINASYIIIDGIEVKGDNANLTYAGAYTAYTYAAGGGKDQSQYAKYNTNGISIGGPNTSSVFPTHVVVQNCKIHDCSGGGISSIQADYTTIQGNLVYNNAWYMMYAGSGISILNPFNSDGVTGYKNIVKDNIVYTNKTQIPWISIKGLSDGNGIIMDVNQTGYNGKGPAYNGRTLVANNVSYNNGGSGIHAFKASHVDIINNTAYGNGTVVGYANIYASSAIDCKIKNNIMYAANNGKCNLSNNGNNNVVYDYNIYYNGTVGERGGHDKVADPHFISLSTDASVANFLLNNGSPAIDGGTRSIYYSKDIRGVARPQGGKVDCGAYEVQ
ncbi:choice-of-anchor Q domain-containing protein [Parasediminibacterium sp. JCM 36343]|uniref:choice-of-anchor Q domain-containing protein n=1 Tax=Parasediminibacterium sp. JCM 36343 TaxID=3374279 RepID=UPI00397CD12A